jgi:hypothetical protein
MEYRTDEDREALGATPEEGEAPEENREPSAESEVATATAVVEDGAGEEDGAEEQGETAPEGGSVAAVADGATANGAATNGTAPPDGTETDGVELYTDSDMEEFRRRWAELLAGFVDDPRASAEQADGLIGELVERVSQRRQELHDALDREDDGGETEAMRQAIKRYRAIYRALVRE